MLTKRTPKTAGFTIVETMIVLAAAALILLLVLQAIPTLQRSSRNNLRKQDIQAILGAVSKWELNNSGTLPHPPGDQYLKYTKLRYYNPANVHVIGLSAGAPPTVSPTSLNTTYVYNHQKCSTISTPSGQGAGYYDTVALYRIETSGGSALRCQQL